MSNETKSNGTALDFFVSNLANSLDPAAEGAGLWEPQRGPQTMAYDSMADETFYGGAAGGGKANSLETDVLTPFGWKKAGDIKVGDKLIAQDGETTTVLGVHPQGKRKLFEITFIDGAKVKVTEDHVWSYWFGGKKLKANREYYLYNEVKGVHIEQTRGKLGTTKQMMEYHQKQVDNKEKGKRPYWLITPLPSPINFTRPVNRYDKPHIIDSYLLGVLLAEGTLTQSTIGFASIESHIVDRVRNGLFDNDSISSSKDNGKHNIVNKTSHEPSDVKKHLEYFGLHGKRSETKFIPKHYLFASIEDRFALMQALIDCDGTVDKEGRISYCTISEQLAKDVQHLARSLGAKATITQREGAYINETGERIVVQDAYVIYINGHYETIRNFVSLPRKLERVTPFNGGNSWIGRRITDIQQVEDGEAVCFTIDNALGLHVVQDFIVTHNSDLLLGWASTRAYKSIIYRREYSQMSQLIDRSKEILNGTGVNDTGANYNANTYAWNNIPGGRMLRFASVPHADSVMKYQGRPHDFIGFDEVTNFLYSQYIFLLAWNRSENPNAITRVIGAGNPPTNVEGEWVIRRWAPWLDHQHGNPAEPGELRWFVTLDDKEEEVEDDTPIQYKDETFYPTSRTYIPATLEDNKYYGAEYRARLQSMPVELRSKFLYGDFGLVFEDNPYQVIPSEFVKIGQARWREMHDSGKLDEIVNVNPAYGLDPSEAGDDKTMLAHITINAVQWIKGTDHTDLMEISNWTVAQMGAHKYAPVGVDAIGVGAGVYYRLRQLNYKASGLKVSSKTKMRDRTGNMQFLNLRAYLWWLMRDALDPHGTIQLAIPPDIELERELMAPRWRMTETGLVQIDKKQVIRERLGRSPDKANALMMVLYVSHVRRPQLRIV